MILAAVAALTVQVPEAPPEGVPTDAQLQRVRTELDLKLLDYPKARFRDVRADRYRVCGLVNAPNRMGAGTGWTKFGALVAGDDVLLYIDDEHMSEVFCTGALMRTPRDYSAEVTHR